MISVLGFAGRDLATRGAPATISNRQPGLYGFLVLIPTGLLMLLFGPAGFVWPEPMVGLQMFAGTGRFIMTGRLNAKDRE